MGAVAELREDAGRLAGRLVLLPRLAHLPLQQSAQALVACQSENVIHAMLFAPVHQFFAAEAGIGAHHDLDPRPALANLADDALDFFDGPCRPVLIRRTQSRAQQMISGKDVQRQIAVAVVVAVKEAPLLMPVQRDVGRVQIEHDPPWPCGVRFQKQIDQHTINLLRGVADLVITRASLIAARQL